MLLVLILIVGVIIWVFSNLNALLNERVKEELSRAIIEDPSQLYTYELGNLEIDIYKGKVVLENVLLRPRRKVLDSLQAAGIDKRVVILGKLELLILEEIDMYKLIWEEVIDIGRIDILHPEIEYYLNRDVAAEESENVLVDIIDAGGITARLGTLELRNAQLNVIGVDADSVGLLTFDSLNYELTGMRIDPTTVRNRKFLEFDDFYIEIRNFSTSLLEDYQLGLGKLQFRRSDSTLTLSNIRMECHQDQYAYQKGQPHEKDWFDIKVNKVELQNISVWEFYFNDRLIVDQVLIDQPVFKGYRDKRLKDAPLKYKPLPSRALREMGFKMRIDTILINSADVTYEEFPVNGKSPMRVTLNELDGYMAHFASDSLSMEAAPVMKFSAEGKLMNEGKMKLNMEFDLLDTMDRFRASGSLAGMSFESLNPLVENTAFIQFHEGRLNFLQFKMSANDMASTGRLDIDYKDLKNVEVLSAKQLLHAKKENKKLNKLMSMMANAYISKDYSPEDDHYVPGKISMHRDRNKAVFNYLAKSLMSGVVTAMVPAYRKDKKDSRKKKKNNKKSSRS